MTQAAVTQLLRDAVIEGSSDPAYWLRFFLPHWFPTPLPPVHLGIAALITRKVSWLKKYPDSHAFLATYFRYMADPNDPESLQLPVFQFDEDGSIRMVAGMNNNIIMPRGFSKTTLYNGLQLCDAVTDPHTFSVYISESSGHAQTQLGNIRAEIETNERIRAAYGNLVPTRSDTEKWAADQLQLTSGAVLVARGRGSQIRGINFRARRPNKILLDDVEDKESVSTADQRQKTLDWFYNSVLPAGNDMSGAAIGQGQDPLQVSILGTLLGSETLITRVAEDPTFNTVRFGARVTEQLENLTDQDMLWPYKLSAADYMAKRRQWASVGQLNGFSLEYDSTVRNEEDAKFKKSFIHYMPVQRSDLIQVAQALDPAISDQPGRDHTALVVAGRRADGAIWFLDEWGGLGKTPREKIDMFFEMYERWQCTHTGIEAVAYQKALIYLMQEEMARRQLFFNVQPILQGSAVRKDDRIVGILAPRYSNGYIKHRRPLPMLETQLLDFPNGKKDFPDAAAMACQLLGETSMFAMPGDAITHDMYQPLDNALPAVYDSGNFLFDGGADAFNDRYGA